MKKLLGLVLSFCVCFALIGCSNEKDVIGPEKPEGENEGVMPEAHPLDDVIAILNTNMRNYCVDKADGTIEIQYTGDLMCIKMNMGSNASESYYSLENNKILWVIGDKLPDSMVQSLKEFAENGNSGKTYSTSDFELKENGYYGLVNITDEYFEIYIPETGVEDVEFHHFAKNGNDWDISHYIYNINEVVIEIPSN